MERRYLMFLRTDLKWDTPKPKETPQYTISLSVLGIYWMPHRPRNARRPLNNHKNKALLMGYQRSIRKCIKAQLTKRLKKGVQEHKVLNYQRVLSSFPIVLSAKWVLRGWTTWVESTLEIVLMSRWKRIFLIWNWLMFRQCLILDVLKLILKQISWLSVWWTPSLTK